MNLIAQFKKLFFKTHFKHQGIDGIALVSPGIIVSLEEIHKQIAGAPYYVISYSLVINIYVILLCLYFFYLNRVDAFIRVHFEPLFQTMPWIQVRTRLGSSGVASRKMTKAVSLPILVIPFLSSLGILVFTAAKYADRLTTFESRNAFLTIFFVSAVLLWGMALRTLLALGSYTDQIVYGVPAPIGTTLDRERAVSRFLAAICPGAVSQPPLPPKMLQPWGPTVAINGEE